MQRYRFCVVLRLRLVSVPAVILLALAISALAQIPNLTDSTSTPLAAAGHDYLGAKLPSDARVFGGTVANYVNPGSARSVGGSARRCPRGASFPFPSALPTILKGCITWRATERATSAGTRTHRT